MTVKSYLILGAVVSFLLIVYGSLLWRNPR